MFAWLSEHFDLVIVDAPPVGVIIDAAEIARNCDGTIFTVRYNSTGRRELQEARRRILNTGCEILGAVLNAVDLETLSGRKYYNKSYYSSYSSDYCRPSENRESPGGRDR